MKCSGYSVLIIFRLFSKYLFQCDQICLIKPFYKLSLVYIDECLEYIFSVNYIWRVNMNIVCLWQVTMGAIQFLHLFKYRGTVREIILFGNLLFYSIINHKKFSDLKQKIFNFSKISYEFLKPLIMNKLWDFCIFCNDSLLFKKCKNI